MEWNSAQPWSYLPRLPPQADLGTKAFLNQCIKARAALGELKVAEGVLREQESGREKLFFNVRLMRLLCARELAVQTGTLLVVSEHGVVKQLRPDGQVQAMGVG